MPNSFNVALTSPPDFCMSPKPLTNAVIASCGFSFHAVLNSCADIPATFAKLLNFLPLDNTSVFILANVLDMALPPLSASIPTELIVAAKAMV